MKLEITLTEAETKAMAYVAEDVQFWATNLVKEHCRLAIEHIVQQEVQRMLADPNVTDIPADPEQIILQATLEPAAERYSVAPPLVGGDTA